MGTGNTENRESPPRAALRRATDDAWAIPPAATAPERARALAARLAEQRFALSDEQRACWPFACAADLPDELGAAGLHWRNDALQTALQAAVEQLAERYFDLPPAERRAHWAELNAAAQYAPELRPRLQHLATALDVPAADLSDPDPRVQTLLDELRVTYALPAEARAARRAALAREKRKELQVWSDAATRGIRRVNALANLRLDHLLAIERAPDRDRQVAANFRAVRASWHSQKSKSTSEHLGAFIAFVAFIVVLVFGITGAIENSRRRRSFPAPSRGLDASESALEELNRSMEQQRERIAQLPVRTVVSRSHWARLRTEEAYRGAQPFGAGPAFRSLYWKLRVNGCSIPASCDLYELDQGLIVVLADADFAAYEDCLESRRERQ